MNLNLCDSIGILAILSVMTNAILALRLHLLHQKYKEQQEHFFTVSSTSPPSFKEIPYFLSSPPI